MLWIYYDYFVSRQNFCKHRAGGPVTLFSPKKCDLLLFISHTHEKKIATWRQPCKKHSVRQNRSGRNSQPSGVSTFLAKACHDREKPVSGLLQSSSVRNMLSLWWKWPHGIGRCQQASSSFLFLIGIRSSNPNSNWLSKSSNCEILKTGRTDHKLIRVVCKSFQAFYMTRFKGFVCHNLYQCKKRNGVLPVQAVHHSNTYI